MKGLIVLKRFAILLIMGLAVILTTSASFAVVQDFVEYTVDVIDGWTAVTQGKTVYFVKNDNSASWSVMFDNLPGKMSVEQYAKDVMKQLKGSNFESDDKNFRFEFTQHKT